MQIELVDLDALRAGQKNGSVYPRAASRVTKWRYDHGKMSQIKFARKAGVSVGCLQALELVQRDTRRPQMEKIAKAMGLTYEELTAGDAEPLKGNDERFKDLFPDDLEVAHMYQRADGTLKMAVRRMLVDYYRHAHEALQEKTPLRLPTDVDFREHRSGVERRSGVDRRDAASTRAEKQAADSRAAALLQRLLQLDPDAMQDIEAMLPEPDVPKAPPAPAAHDGRLREPIKKAHQTRKRR